MPEFKITLERVTSALNCTAAIQAWLRPGSLAFVFGEHTDGLRTHAIRLAGELNGMTQEFGLKYPDVLAVDDPLIQKEPEKYKAGEPHPLAGQAMTQVHADGTSSTPLMPERTQDFRARHAELMATEVTIFVSERLTMDHIARIDKERLEAPRSLNGAPPSNDAIDFSALIPLIERKEYNRDGIAISGIPAENGHTRVASLSPSR